MCKQELTAYEVKLLELNLPESPKGVMCYPTPRLAEEVTGLTSEQLLERIVSGKIRCYHNCPHPNHQWWCIPEEDIRMLQNQQMA